jgi:uncharacterized protein
MKRPAKAIANRAGTEAGEPRAAMRRRVEVKVHPKARHEKIEPDGAGGYRVWTTAPPDKGAANDAVTRMLAKHLGIAPSRVTLVRGAASRSKLFEIGE